MDSFELIWKELAERDLRKLDPQHIARVIEAVEPLAANPFPPGCRKLRGSDQDYRIRVGDYRVIYQVSSAARKVTVFRVRHRSVAYRE